MAKKKNTKRNGPKLTSLIGVLALFFFIIYFLFLRKKELQTVKVNLVWLNQAQFAGIYVAHEKGFYEAQGLDVIIEEFDFKKNLEQELVDGETDFSIIHAVRFLEGVGKGLDLKAVAAIYQQSPHSFVTSKAKTIKQPSDFIGKKLGIKGGNRAGKILYSAFLSKLGIASNQVSFLEVGFDTSEFEDISNGTVDMIDLYRTDQVYTFQKNDYGYSLLLPEDFGFEMYGDIIAVSGEKLKNDPRLVRKFVSASLKGWEYAIENQEEAVEITQKYITSDNYQDKEHNAFILEESSHLIKSKVSQKIGAMELLKWKKLYDIMLSDGLLEKEFNIEDVYTDEFVE